MAVRPGPFHAKPTDVSHRAALVLARKNYYPDLGIGLGYIAGGVAITPIIGTLRLTRDAAARAPARRRMAKERTVWTRDRSPWLP